MIEIETTKEYTDVTNEWLTNSTPNNYKVKIAKYYKYNNVKYYVDGKLVILDFTQKEKEMAIWLAKSFGGEIYILSRINYPQKVKTPDYLFRGEKWDLKSITKNASSKTRAVDNIIKTSKLQTDNIILDITDTSICKENIIRQAENIFSTSGREWLKKIMIVDNYNLIKVYERK